MELLVMPKLRLSNTINLKSLFSIAYYYAKRPNHFERHLSQAIFFSCDLAKTVSAVS